MERGIPGDGKRKAWFGLAGQCLVVIGLGHLDKAGEGGADLPDGKDGMDLM